MYNNAPLAMIAPALSMIARVMLAGPNIAAPDCAGQRTAMQDFCHVILSGHQHQSATLSTYLRLS